MIWLICMLLGAAIVIVFWLSSQELEDLGEENRDYKDPLPPLLRAIWPAVRWAEAGIVPFMPRSMHERVERQLTLGELRHLIDPAQFLGLKVVAAIFALLAAALVAAMLDGFSLLWLPLAAGAGFFLPDLKVNDLRTAYVRKVNLELPTLLDFLVLGIESGNTLIAAIRLAVAKSPPGPLHSEFSRVMRDISAGVTRAEALTRMRTRVDVKEVSGMVAAMIQAEKVGASLGPILREQAAQRRAERFLLAEKKAFEAPVKMVAPLVVFIFPCTFAFLGYFLYQKVAGTGIF